MDTKLIVHIATLLWHDYAQKDSLLQREKNSSDDGSPDWELFHEDRLINSKNDRDEAYDMFLAFKSEYREIINTAFGI